jgi:hypothetical protein
LKSQQNSTLYKHQWAADCGKVDEWAYQPVFMAVALGSNKRVLVDGKSVVASAFQTSAEAARHAKPLVCDKASEWAPMCSLMPRSSYYDLIYVDKGQASSKSKTLTINDPKSLPGIAISKRQSRE